MKSSLFGVVFLAVIALTIAVPSSMVEDEKDQWYYLTPILSRQRRGDSRGFGEGGGTRHGQGGYAGVNNPDGSGGTVGYGHANSQGHTVSVDGRVPVWSNKNRYGESTVNLGGGTTHHVGGPGGSQNLDKRVGVNFNHRF